ncbi:MAG: GNAT family N-acetyltransferase [Flavobacteriaceae bacterium]
MKLLRAQKKDLVSIMSIINDAQELLAGQNIDQWQNGYPNTAIVLKDIQNNESFILKSESGVCLATAMFSTKNEPTYSKIEGHWINPKQTIYGVIHRMAVAKNYRGKGLAKFFFNQCEQKLSEKKIPSMRIDTHKDNFGMQKLLKTMGYSYCGVIYLENGDKRLAFEKLIQ